MKTRLLLLITLALSSQLLISCVGTGTTAVIGPAYGPYYGNYYGPYAGPYYGQPYRAYRPTRVVVRERPGRVVAPNRGRTRNFVTPPRPSRDNNYNVRPHRSVRTR